MRGIWICLVCALALCAGPAWADDAAIGFVKTVSGPAKLWRNDVSQAVEPGTAIYEGDRLETGGGGLVGITFRDDTRISVGESTQLTVGRFVFKPAEQQYGFVLRLAVGTLQYMSGLTGKLAPQAISVETPQFTVGVRGTRFLVRAE